MLSSGVEEMGHLVMCFLYKSEHKSAVPHSYFKQARPIDNVLMVPVLRGEARHVPGALNQQAAGLVRHP